MKAILLSTHGGPKVLQYTDFPEPDLQPGQALVKLHAAALNHMDLFVRAGWPGLKLDYPHILGADGAGEIVNIGDSSTELIAGDHVVINANIGCGQCDYCLEGKDNLCRTWHLLGETMRGTYAQYIAIHNRQLFKIPDDFSYGMAAAAGLVFHTAWHSLVKRGNLQAGETVLIVGASGGVNTACVQVAKFLGSRVLVVGSSQKKLDLAKSLGADMVILRQPGEDWSKLVFQATERQGVDVVVDNVGTTFPLSFRTLKKGGRLLTVGNTASPKFEIDNRYIFSKHLSILGSSMGTIKDFEEVMNLVIQSKLTPAISRTFDLENASQAHKHLESGQNLGKVVLTIPD